MVSSGKGPRDPGSHSFSNDWHILKMMPLLVSGDFNERSLMLKAAIWDRLSASCLSASMDKGKMLTIK